LPFFSRFLLPGFQASQRGWISRSSCLLPWSRGVDRCILIFPFKAPATSTTPYWRFTGIAPIGLDISTLHLVAFLFCYLSHLVINFSAAGSIEQSLMPKGMDCRLRRVMAVTGPSSIVAGFAGDIGCGNLNFSMNVVLVSRQSSWYPRACSGIRFIIVAFSPAIISTLWRFPCRNRMPLYPPARGPV